MVKFNLSARERHMYIITISLIVLAAGYNFIFEPMLTENSRLNNKLSIKKAMVNRGVKLLQKRDAIINEYNTRAKSFSDISKILDYIEKEAFSCGIKTTDIKPRPIIQAEFYNEYMFELTLEGAFTDIYKFVSRLIQPPLYISIRQFELHNLPEAHANFRGTVVLSALII